MLFFRRSSVYEKCERQREELNKIRSQERKRGGYKKDLVSFCMVTL